MFLTNPIIHKNVQSVKFYPERPKNGETKLSSRSGCGDLK